VQDFSVIAKVEGVYFAAIQTIKGYGKGLRCCNAAYTSCALITRNFEARPNVSPPGVLSPIGRKNLGG